MKRTFIAIDIAASEKLKESYDRIRHCLRYEKINWVAVDQLHITLNFLGDTEEEKLPEMVQGIGRILSGQPSFEIVLRSLGVFRSLRDPRVIWIGCDPGVSLPEIKQGLDTVLSGLGFKQENREFSPHLTIGRIKGMRQQNQLSQLISSLIDVTFQKQVIDHVVLYESKLMPDGPVYTAIQHFPLNRPD